MRSAMPSPPQESGMNKLLGGYCRLIEWLLVALMGLMVVLVFGNVVARYAFNSGITVSEEVSRWLFVWMTFLGAIVGVRERAHLGSDMLTSRLGPTGKKVCLAPGADQLGRRGPGHRRLGCHLLQRRRGLRRLGRPDAGAGPVAHPQRPTARGRTRHGPGVRGPGPDRGPAPRPEPHLQEALTWGTR